MGTKFGGAIGATLSADRGDACSSGSRHKTCGLKQRILAMYNLEVPGLSACRLSCRRRWLAGGKASGKTSVIVFGNQQTRPPGEQSIPVLQRHGACYAQCGQARTIPAPAVSPVRGHPDILYRSIAFSPERQRSFGTAGLSVRPRRLSHSAFRLAHACALMPPCRLSPLLRDVLLRRPPGLWPVP